jgi:predicted DNA-binding transcriptional regulator AlpA
MKKRKKAIPYEFKSIRGALITIEEASEITRKGKDWFYEHMTAGTLPFPWFLIDGARVMDAADVDDWLGVIKVPAGTRPLVQGVSMRK